MRRGIVPTAVSPSMKTETTPGHWLDLGLMAYAPAFAIQSQVLQARLDGRLAPTIICRRTGRCSPSDDPGAGKTSFARPGILERRGIEVLEVNRGGDVTYHGPGQLIVSPLLFLGDVGLNANEYLHRLEDLIIDLLARYGLPTAKKEGYPGVWYQGEKIAALGIAVKHGFTFHGFSLNLDPDLEAFSLINPCGVKQMPVTSIRQVLGWDAPLRRSQEPTEGDSGTALCPGDAGYLLVGSPEGIECSAEIRYRPANPPVSDSEHGCQPLN